MELDFVSKQPRDERRTAILHMAHEAFLAEGFSATSMSVIAARAGGSKATLYNYFASKDELFRAVVQDRCAEVWEALEGALKPGEDIVAVLTLVGVEFSRSVLSDNKVATYRMIIAEAARFPDIGALFYEMGPQRGQQIMAAFFGRAIEAGQLKPGDQAQLARTFLHLCLGDLHQRRLLNLAPAPSAEQLNENVKRAVTMFMAAYGAAP